MNRQQRRQAQRQKNSTPTQRPVRVCVASLHTRHVETRFLDDWTNLLRAWGDIIVEVVSITGSLTADARNTIARKLLASDADYLFTVDDDMRFDPDVLPRLLAHAHPTDRPIVGALCFKVHRGGDIDPTLYQLATEPHQHLQVQRDWEDGELLQVAATGAACMVVHRSVFEKMDEPWFGSGWLSGEQLGEDTTFMLAAGQAGFPVFVATDVHVGHIKPKAWGIDDWRRQQRERAEIPTFVVVPVRHRDDPLPLDWDDLPPNVAGMIAVDNWPDGTPGTANGTNTPRKWNHGLAWAREKAASVGIDKWNVLFLNDDVRFDAERVVAQLGAALRSDPQYALAYPNWHGFDGTGIVETRTDDPGGLTHSGWCFMVRGETAERFDDRFVWWFADNDYELRIAAAGKKVVCVLDCHVDHLRPNEATFATPAILEQARKDEALFAQEYGIDPKSLSLAGSAASSAS